MTVEKVDVILSMLNSSEKFEIESFLAKSRCYISLSDPTHSIVVIRVTFFQIELMVETCSKSLVRAIGKLLLMKFS